MGCRVESGFELEITCSDTIRNYQLSQKLKLLGYGAFRALILCGKPKSNRNNNGEKYN